MTIRQFCFDHAHVEPEALARLAQERFAHKVVNRSYVLKLHKEAAKLLQAAERKRG